VKWSNSRPELCTDDHAGIIGMDVTLSDGNSGTIPMCSLTELTFDNVTSGTSCVTVCD